MYLGKGITTISLIYNYLKTELCVRNLSLYPKQTRPKPINVLLSINSGFVLVKQLFTWLSYLSTGRCG